MAFENVPTNSERLKLQLLEQVAQSGSQGRAAFEAAQKQIGTAQQDAVARALAEKQKTGIDYTGTDLVNTGAQRRIDALSQSKGLFDADLARRSDTTQNYLTQVAGAVPAQKQTMDNEYTKSKAELERQLALRQSDMNTQLSLAEQAYKQRQEEEAAAKAWEEEQRNFQREKMQWDRADRSSSTSSSSGGGTASPVADLPYGEQQDSLLGMAKLANAGSGPFASLANIGKDTGNILANITNPGPAPLSQNARMIGMLLGLDSGAVAGMPKLADPVAKPEVDTVAKALASKYATKGIDLPTARTILDNEDFQDDVTWLMSGADGKAYDEVDQLLRDAYLPGHPRTYEILRGEFLSRIPKTVG